MAPSRSTTLRVPVELRDEIARIARQRGSTLVEVVSDAVHRLERDEWWSTVHEALDGWGPQDVESYRSDHRRLDITASDGMDER